MKIAYTMGTGRGNVDLLLQYAAQNLVKQGLRVCGTVQINTKRPKGGPCDMDVQVLPGGPILRISQNLGKNARGCRLDPSSLETAVGLVDASIQEGADVLLVNKFGKHEADGRGFRSAIADALAREMPILVGVNALSLEAFIDFVGNDAVKLAPSLLTINQWLKDQVGEVVSRTNENVSIKERHGALAVSDSGFSPEGLR